MKKEILKEAIKAVLLNEWYDWDRAGSGGVKDEVSGAPTTVLISKKNDERVYFCDYSGNPTLDSTLKKFKPLQDKCLLSIITKKLPREIKTIQDLSNNLWTRKNNFNLLYETKCSGKRCVIVLGGFSDGRDTFTVRRFFRENEDLDLQFVYDNFYSHMGSKRFIKFK